MTGAPLHPSLDLQDLADARLDEPRRGEVLAHLETCERCRRELAALRWISREVAGQGNAASSTDEPARLDALRKRIGADLDSEDWRVRAAQGGLRAPRAWTRRAWVVGGLAAAAAIVMLTLPRERRSVPDLVAADYDGIVSGTARLDVTSSDPRVIEAHFAANGAPFVTRVIDLAMMQFQLIGGRVQRLDRAPSVLYAYTGPGGSSLVCQMYLGRTDELPPADDVRENEGTRFHVFRRGNRTLVFWQEGDVTCVLTSTLPGEDVIQLAFAKAQRAGAAAD